MSFAEYKSIFNYFEHAPTEPEDIRLIQSEWMKFSLHLNLKEEETKKGVVDLMFGYLA